MSVEKTDQELINRLRLHVEAAREARGGRDETGDLALMEAAPGRPAASLREAIP